MPDPMTTISLAEVFTVTLDDHKLALTPTMGLMRRIGIVEEMAASRGAGLTASL